VPFDFFDIDFQSPGIDAAYIKFVPLFNNQSDASGSIHASSSRWGMNEIEIYVDRAFALKDMEVGGSKSGGSSGSGGGHRALSALEYLLMHG
jgi:hypothetical protein